MDDPTGGLSENIKDMTNSRHILAEPRNTHVFHIFDRQRPTPGMLELHPIHAGRGGQGL